MQRDARTRSALLGLAGLLLVATVGVGLWRLLAPSGDGGNGGTIESVPLPAGCSDVALSWPAGTPLEVVVASLSRLETVESIWRRDEAGARYLTFMPAQRERSDYMATAARPERAIVCPTAPAVLNRPAGTSNVPVAVAMPSNDQPAASAAGRPSGAAPEPIAAVPKAAGHGESFPHRRRRSRARPSARRAKSGHRPSRPCPSRCCCRARPCRPRSAARSWDRPGF